MSSFSSFDSSSRIDTCTKSSHSTTTKNLSFGDASCTFSVVFATNFCPTLFSSYCSPTHHFRVGISRFEAENIRTIDLHQPVIHWFKVKGVGTEFFVDPALNDSVAVVAQVCRLAELCSGLAEHSVELIDHEEERNVVGTFFKACHSGDNDAIKRILAHHGTYPLVSLQA